MGSKFVERDRCPACCGTDSVRLFFQRFDEEPLGSWLREYYGRPMPHDDFFDLEKCVCCGLVFQRFIGSETFLAELYSEWLTQGIDAEYMACLAEPEGSRDGHELMTLSAHLRKANLKVLDYGTGWGLWPAIAARLGHEVYATELAPEKADWVSKNGVTIIADEEIGRHRFDVINLEQVLEHVPEPRGLLQSLVPSLSGIIKIAVPNAAYANIEEFKNGDFSRLPLLQPFEHINGFSAESLRALSHAVGLREVRPTISQRYAFLPHLPKSPKRAAREILRPIIQFRSRHNLYRWFAPS